MNPLGVLHPLFVHFPFALVVVAALLEWRSRRRRPEALGVHTLPLLVLAAAGSMLAGATGWIAAASWTGSEEVLRRLEWHRWLGVSTTVGLLLLLLLLRPSGGRELTRARLRLGRGLLLVTLGLVGAGGHLGAELTHGAQPYRDALDRLLGRAPGSSGARKRELAARVEWSRAALARWEVPPEGMIDYTTDIQPILVAHCWSCHGDARVRGGLRLDSRERAILGGDTGPALVPGSAEESALWFRCVTDTPEHPRMPEDASALAEEWTVTLARWIDEGARWPVPEPTPWQE
ncbi:MAG: c-type cytochrome domain-containing protein [Planctomycetota bacterium]